MVSAKRSHELVEEMLNYAKDELQPTMLKIQQLFHQEMQQRKTALQGLIQTLRGLDSQDEICDQLARHVESEENDLPALSRTMEEYTDVLS